METFRVAEPDSGKRADVFLSAKLPKFTRASLKSLFDNQLVQLNGQAVKPGQKLRKDDQMSLDVSELNTPPEDISLPVLYEDEDVLVINKPAGLLTHSKGALNREATVASFIKPRIDKRMDGNRAGIVHRLDRGTSGVIITAKNTGAIKYLQKQFSTRKVGKTYLAIVEGELSPPAATIDVPIQRNPKNPQAFRAGEGGKPAQTNYKLVKTFKRGGKSFSLVELTPLTGRTHQLRVHLSYIGYPIAGDQVYGNASSDTPMLLHALSLDITLPGGKRARFEAPEPKTVKEFHQ